jgi:hypothetical protein
VILVAVPSPEADDVKGGLRVDGVVEGSRLVVEEFGGIHRESRDGRAESIRRDACVGVYVLDKVGSPYDPGAVGGGKVDQVCR